jgi:hypothetical protein
MGGGEADVSVCEFLSNMDSEFWTKPVGVFGFWCRDVSGTGTDMERLSPARTQKHEPATSEIQNPYRRGIVCFSTAHSILKRNRLQQVY